MDKTDESRNFDELVVRAKVVSKNPRFVAMALASASPTKAGKRAEKAGLDVNLVKGVADLARIFKNFPERLMELWERKEVVMIEQKKYDFAQTGGPDGVVFDEKTDVDTTLSFFAFTEEVMRWFREVGKRRLEQSAHSFISFMEWEELLQKFFYLWWYLGGSLAIGSLFVKVVESGIHNLFAYVKSQKADERLQQAYWSWFTSISYQLEPGARLGLGGKCCSEEKTRELLMQLVNIAQYIQSVAMLQSIARNLYPRDDVSQHIFIGHFKNWD